MLFLNTETMKFAYPHHMFAVKGLAMLAMLACIVYLLGAAGIDMLWLIVFSVVFCIMVFVLFFSPFFTEHEIEGDGIILRQGLIFSISLPFARVERVGEFKAGTGPLGPVSRRGRIVIASTARNLVTIKLDHKRRFGMLMLRKADEIIIDLNEPDEFIKLANGFLEDNSH